MIAIYIGYVLSVLLGELYKKKYAKQVLNKEQMANPENESIDKYMMPVLSVFSNESMRDLFNDVKQNDNNAVNVLENVSNNIQTLYQDLTINAYENKMGSHAIKHKNNEVEQHLQNKKQCLMDVSEENVETDKRKVCLHFVHVLFICI